jgi:hypothetical protein
LDIFFTARGFFKPRPRNYGGVPGDACYNLRRKKPDLPQNAVGFRTAAAVFYFYPTARQFWHGFGIM